jgi:hypothetical protein
VSLATALGELRSVLLGERGPGALAVLGTQLSATAVFAAGGADFGSESSTFEVFANPAALFERAHQVVERAAR